MPTSYISKFFAKFVCIQMALDKSTMNYSFFA